MYYFVSCLIDYKNYIQKNGYRKQAKDDVDFAIRQAYTYDDFKKVLSKMDYEVYERYGKVTIKKPNHQPIRLERAYGENYSKYIKQLWKINKTHIQKLDYDLLRLRKTPFTSEAKFYFF